MELDAEDIDIGGGRFWILRSNPEVDDYVFGIVDEAAKMNLNSATNDMLLKVQGMTTELAAAIIDWRSEDTQSSAGGADSGYYLLLDDPYEAKNSPFETVDELLLVRGAEPEMLTGRDINRNGVIDPEERDLRNGEGLQLEIGFYDYFTVYSREPNTAADGEDRVNVNSANTQEISDLLRDVVSEDRFFPMVERVRRRRPYQNAIHFYYSVGLEYDEFREIADRVTVEDRRTLTGRVNVNTAPRHILLCLPELDESDVDALIQGRQGSEARTDGIAWITQVLPEEKAIAIGGVVTTRSYQFSVDIVTLSENGRGWQRRLAIIDTRQAPRVLLWKDLTHLGWPLDPGIVEEARQAAR